MSTVQDFGRKVEGEILTAETLPEQADPQEFLDALDRLLDIPEVEAVRWDQYTPYWNDGEPCVFSTGNLLIKIEVAEESDEDDYEEYSDGFRSNYSLDLGKYSYSSGSREFIPNPDREDLALAFNNFAQNLGKKHYLFLQKSFGDHAEVTATKEGFSIEFYEHE